MQVCEVSSKTGLTTQGMVAASSADKEGEVVDLESALSAGRPGTGPAAAQAAAVAGSESTETRRNLRQSVHEQQPRMTGALHRESKSSANGAVLRMGQYAARIRALEVLVQSKDNS